MCVYDRSGGGARCAQVKFQNMIDDEYLVS